MRGFMNRVVRPFGALATVLMLVATLSASPSVAQSLDDGYAGSRLGSYIAGRIARGANDTSAAVRFYREALKAAPDDPSIIEAAFLVEATEGHADRAIRLAAMLTVTGVDASGSETSSKYSATRKPSGESKRSWYSAAARLRMR